MQKSRVSEIVQDKEGRLLGKYEANRALIAAELQTVRDFLIAVQKTQLKGENMAKQETKKQADRCNIAYLAGIIRKLTVREDGSAFMLLDTESDSKFIACTVYENKPLAKGLSRFNEDDEIKLVGFVRAWSQKKDTGWENKMEIRITEIKSEPPARRAAPAQQQFDDDVPF